MKNTFKDFYIGDLKIEIPIIQGGMGVRVSTASLATAVSNEGGLGVIAAVALGEGNAVDERDFRARSRSAVVNNIKECQRLTKNPVGINIMCALANYDELVVAAQETKVDVIISGAGLPLKLPSLSQRKETKLIPIVSSARAAQLICSVWKRRYNRLPDAFVVEGPLAGGHLGYSREQIKDKSVSLQGILVEVLSVVRVFETDKHKIPVIAAGGIFDGKDIAEVIRLGASAVQMATRFVCTHECDVSMKYKEAYLTSTPENIVIIQSPVGMPGRVVRNEFVDRISAGERIDFGCAYKCLSTCDPKKVNYCIAKALINASKGNMDKGFAMCGSNAYRIKKIISVKELITELVTEARANLKD